MNVLMIGVDKTSVGGMLTVVENYLNDKEFCNQTNLNYIATVIRSNKIKKITTFIRKIPQIIYIIRKKKIDIVHVHMAERGSVFREGFVILLAKILGCKTLIHMHGATIEEWYKKQNFLIKKLTERIFCLADRMVVLGENWKPFIISVMGEKNKNKVVVLHNAVSVPDCNKYNFDSKNILFYGMLIQRKGIDDLLQAFASIVNEIPEDIMLTLYGDDHDSEEKIQDKINRYKLQERVHYMGWLTKDNRADVFRNTIVNVLPSYNEGLPMTILESMGYGIPNISTSIAAIPEALVDGINGFLIKPGDIDKLAAKIKEIVCYKDIRGKMSYEAYEMAKNEFSFEIHTKKLIEIYKTMLNKEEK